MHLELNPVGDFRIVAISDCHGGLHVFEKLIKRLSLCEEDYLIIIGDFLQKGPFNREMLSYVKDLSQRPKTFILTGNHEYYIQWLLERDHVDQFKKHLNSLWHDCILDEWLKELGSPYDMEKALEQQDMIKNHFSKDLAFLRHLPVTLEMDQFIFVHGGVDDGAYREADFRTLLKRDQYYLEGHRLDKYVVCGHWPVGNYKMETLSCAPILDHEKKIFSIDGGQGVKSYGQINALIIDKVADHYTYDWIYEDAFDEVEVIEDHEGLVEVPVKLSYGSNIVKITGEEGRFYECIKEATGEVTRVPKVLMAFDGDVSYVKRNWVNYYPSVKKGDKIKLVDHVDWLAMVKVDGEIGWLPKTCIKIDLSK